MAPVRSGVGLDRSVSRILEFLQGKRPPDIPQMMSLLRSAQIQRVNRFVLNPIRALYATVGTYFRHIPSRGIAESPPYRQRLTRQHCTGVSAIEANLKVEPGKTGENKPIKSMKKVVEKEPSTNVRTNEATLRPKAVEIADRLSKLYPSPPIPLQHESGYQLLVAVVLSAQTTDVKVNEVTPELFKMGSDAAAMSKCDVKDIERVIGTLGLAPTKAKNVKALSVQLIEEHKGSVPKTFEELEALPGVGHKTASVVMSQVHGLPSFPVDTHIHRLAQRWGLTDGSSVEQTEADLKFLFPKESWNDLHLQIIYFGREFCPARGHDPATCPLCSWAAVHPYDSPAGTETTKSPQGKARKRASQKKSVPSKRAKKL
jgi:endonuclease-3